MVLLFHSNNTGDQCLRRVKAGLDPHQTTFGDLPPHFKVGMDNEDILDFIYLLYGPIIRKRKKKLKITLYLLLFATSLVYHSGTFAEIMLQKPNHCFQGSQCSLIGCYLEQKKKLATKDLTLNLHEATGIPPHIQMMETIKEIHNQLKDLDRNISQIGASISRVAQVDIEQNDARSGLLTHTTMEQKPNDFMRSSRPCCPCPPPPAIDDELGSDIATRGADIFQMDGDS